MRSRLPVMQAVETGVKLGGDVKEGRKEGDVGIRDGLQ